MAKHKNTFFSYYNFCSNSVEAISGSYLLLGSIPKRHISNSVEAADNFFANFAERPNLVYNKAKWESFEKLSSRQWQEQIDSDLAASSNILTIFTNDDKYWPYIQYLLVCSFIEGNSIHTYPEINLPLEYVHNPLDHLAIELKAGGELIYFYELVDGQWKIYSTIPTMKNRRYNSFYFEPHQSTQMNFFKFSDLFISNVITE